MRIEFFRNNKKIELVEKLINTLDGLYDDLTYENTEPEIECIKSQIQIRLDLLKQLGSLS